MEQSTLLNDYTLVKRWVKVLQEHPNPEIVLRVSCLNEAQQNKILNIISMRKTRSEFTISYLIEKDNVRDQTRKKLTKWNNHIVKFLNSDSYKNSLIRNNKILDLNLNNLANDLANRLINIDQHDAPFKSDFMEIISSERKKINLKIIGSIYSATIKINYYFKYKVNLISKSLICKLDANSSTDPKWKLKELIKLIKIANDILESRAESKKDVEFWKDMKKTKNELKRLADSVMDFTLSMEHQDSYLINLQEFNEDIFQLYSFLNHNFKVIDLCNSRNTLEAVKYTTNLMIIDRIRFLRDKIICSSYNLMIQSIEETKPQHLQLAIKWAEFLRDPSDKTVWTVDELIQLIKIIDTCLQAKEKSKVQNSKKGFIFYNFTHEDLTQDPISKCAEFLGLPKWIEPEGRDKASFNKHMRRLTYMYHPDRNEDNPYAKEILQKIQQAKNQLLL